MFNQCNFLLMALLVVPAISQVQRHNNKFFINFDRAHSNTKMIPDYVIERHKDLSLRECVVKCYLNEGCQTINHKDSLECEILNSTSLVTKNILERKSGWTFYEADPTTKNTGPICMNLSPCPDSHVCVDTPEGTSQFKCKCVEGFKGPNCNNYIGPGRYQMTPAGSCYLLKMKYKGIPNGYYWLQKNNKVKRVFCNMHHDKGLGTSKKSAIASCEWLKEKKTDSITEFYWTVDNDTEVISKKLCVFLIHPEVIGRWSTIYGTKFFGEFALLEDGTLKNKTESMTLKPSKEKKIFPYSQGWMMTDHGSPLISDYFRYKPDDDTLEHFYFDKGADGTTSYKGLKNFVTRGNSTRKGMVGRWIVEYEGTSGAEIIISDDGTIEGKKYTLYGIIPSDEKDAFPPTLGWMMFYYGLRSRPDYFRYKLEDDTLEHVYFDKYPNNKKNEKEYKGIMGFDAFGKSTRKTMVGKWKTIYDNLVRFPEINESGTISYEYGTFELKPSDKEEQFPSYQGWMLFHHSASKYEYIQYDFKTDTINHSLFIAGFYESVGTSERSEE